MYIYLLSMILSHIIPTKIFWKFSQVQKNPYLFLFKAWQSTGPVNRLCSRPRRLTARSTAFGVQDVHACARLLVDRPVDWPKIDCSLFFVSRPTGQPPVQTLFALCGRSTDESTTANGYMPDRLPVDRAGRPTAGLLPPTALSKLVKTDFSPFLVGRNFWSFGD